MTRDLIAEVAVAVPSEHAEGPVWSVDDAALIWVDQYRGRVLRARPGEAPTTVAEVGGPIGAIVPVVGGGWAVAARDGFGMLDRDGGFQPIESVLPDDGVARRMNDGKCDPSGAFWAGSMAFDKSSGAGSLYRLRAGRAEEVLAGVTISNGLAWSGDGRTLHYIDTPTQTVRRFGVSSDGSLVDERVVVRLDPEIGAPDGMCIDREGALWVAVWGAGAVHRYAPTGELLERVLVDAPQVSSCCFGGDDLRTLFVTTSREDYDDVALARHPRAGMIFAVRTGTEGFLPDAYRAAS